MDFSPLQLNLILLDAALTDKPWNEVAHRAYQKQWTTEKWIDDIYYLSDGGYSRIVLDEETGKIFLASESLNRPKDLWPLMQKIVREIEQIIQRDLINFGWEPFEE